MHSAAGEKKSMTVICQYLHMNCIRIQRRCRKETKNHSANAKCGLLARSRWLSITKKSCRNRQLLGKTDFDQIILVRCECGDLT